MFLNPTSDINQISMWIIPLSVLFFIAMWDHYTSRISWVNLVKLFQIGDTFTLPWFHICNKHCTKQSQSDYAPYCYGIYFMVIFCPCHCFSPQSSDHDIPEVESVGGYSSTLSTLYCLLWYRNLQDRTWFLQVITQQQGDKRKQCSLKEQNSY